jgi:hypothetical protein
MGFDRCCCHPAALPNQDLSPSNGRFQRPLAGYMQCRVFSVSLSQFWKYRAYAQTAAKA